jgi:hypothetical protein
MGTLTVLRPDLGPWYPNRYRATAESFDLHVRQIVQERLVQNPVIRCRSRPDEPASS